MNPSINEECTEEGPAYLDNNLAVVLLFDLLERVAPGPQQQAHEVVLRVLILRVLQQVIQSGHSIICTYTKDQLCCASNLSKCDQKFVKKTVVF